MEAFLNIPLIKIKYVYNADYQCIYYELYLNDKYEGRYQTINDVNWRIGLILTEEALAVVVKI